MLYMYLAAALGSPLPPISLSNPLIESAVNTNSFFARTAGTSSFLSCVPVSYTHLRAHET